MRMATALALALVVSVSGLVGVSSRAYAVNSNISGTACTSYYGSQTGDFEYSGPGILNVAASGTSDYIVCPVVRSPTSSNQVTAYLDGSVPAGSTAFCTLYSFDYTGTFLGSQSSSNNNTFDVLLSVPGSYYGNASVICLLPYQGQIFDIDVVQ